MSKSRVKSFAYEEDYDDDFAEEEYEEAAPELTDEDREQLEQGTKKVREVLGTAVSVSDKDIQDSLWHYYYDVEKVVNYILSEHVLQRGWRMIADTCSTTSERRGKAS